MPTQGLSLVGFTPDQQFALGHLRVDCVPNPVNASDTYLLAMWAGAQKALGNPVPNAGSANPQPLTPPMQTYVNALIATPWVAEQLQQLNAVQASVGLQPATFQTVELDPLLAYQWIVDTGRSRQNCQELGSPPTETELLNLCLPSAQPNEPFYSTPVTDQSQSILIKLRNHNLQLAHWGIFDGLHGAKLAGVLFRVGLPFVHVVRYGGRCYLHNGYHRAYGARSAGATRIPCIFREVSNMQMVGLRQDGGTIPEAILTGPNPPTLSHFFGGRAVAVQLRAKSRVLHVTWQQYSVPDEYD
jgi:hypothetical protein